MNAPVFCRPSAFTAFRAELPELHSTTGLLRSAASIALHEKPESDIDRVVPSIRELARTVRGRVRSDASAAVLAHLHDVLFDVMGLSGNEADYYNPENSYLSDVLRSGRGIPITLSLVYKGVAAELGLPVHGVNAPGHFLVAVDVSEGGSPGPMYVDPFYGGGILNREEVHRRIEQSTGRRLAPGPELLRRASHRQWLARMLNNLQAVFAARGRQRDVYAMQELQQLVWPP